MSALLVLRGALESVRDPDLPMHLALGEWIVANRAVPTVEPFAWTRPGAPFFAYSWGMEVVLHLVSESFGKLGLRIINGFTIAAAFLAMILLGRVARWDPRTTLVMAVLNVAMLDVVANSVRPQGLMFSMVPLAWALALLCFRARKPASALIALAATSAFTANVHIFFPLVAIGWYSWILEPRRDKRRIVAVMGATVAGWMATPYTVMLPKMFSLNSAENPLLASPSPISELQPGFTAARWSPVVFPLVVFLCLLPWFSRDASRTRAGAIVLGALWLFGLAEFANAARLLLVWWLLVLPLAAAAVDRVVRYVTSSEQQGVRLWRITAVWAVCSLMFVTTSPFQSDAWAFEDPERRRLSPLRENGLEHVSAWLECNTRPDAKGRVFTTFRLGSALTWRLPQYSMSIDGRTIFPDSVSKPEAYYKLFVEPYREGAWRSADLAIVGVPTSISNILDKADGWKRLAIAHRPDASTGVWVRDEWWSRWGVRQAGPRHVALMPSSEVGTTGNCTQEVPASVGFSPAQ